MDSVKAGDGNFWWGDDVVFGWLRELGSKGWDQWVTNKPNIIYPISNIIVLG